MARTVITFTFLFGLFILPSIVWTFENIALNKSAWQKHPYKDNMYPASLAVDGRKSSLFIWGGECVVSDYSREAEWRVDLGDILSIHHIYILYASNTHDWDENDFKTKSFLGFSVYLSNTTEKDDGILCFKDTDYNKSTIPNPINIACAFHGRYVIYYNNRTHPPFPDGYSNYAYTDLCEVEVYGCPKAEYYGPTSSSKCPQNCQEDNCDVIEETCLGCIAGYTGDFCDEKCRPFKYGVGCNRSCGSCLDRKPCNHVDGSCPNGCDFGSHGDKCDIPCASGWYGKDCKNNCGIHCNSCNRFDGQCEFGCHPGWKGQTCQQKCDSGKFGHNCNESCGMCLGQEPCHHVKGTCLGGCDRGYYGIMCTEECKVGSFGYNCNKSCNRNCIVIGECDRVTGHCNGGCQPGWNGTKCHTECDGGTFGQNCTESCGMCLEKEQCHHINGSCLRGCDRGYRGINCTQECDMGLYGYNCDQFCSSKCLGTGKCDKVTGECEGGCQPGWKGSKCNKECGIRFFGYNCEKSCSDNCLVPGNCNRVTGKCEGGCQPGWKGFNCNRELPKDNKPSRTIIFIVLASTITVIIGVALFITIKRLRMKTTIEFGQENSQEMGVVDDAYNNYDVSTLEINNHQTSATTTLYSELPIMTTTCRSSGGEMQKDKETEPDITIEELHYVIKELKTSEENEETALKRDYSLLPCGVQFTCHTGKSKENLFKNRYKTILPYDHSRVILDEKYDTSDYINANYMKGINGENSCIATQGPTKKTIKSFWAMICQENVSQIVMLTELSEGGKIKCTRYWSKCLKDRIYGNYVIKNIEEHQHACYTIRRLVISNAKHKRSNIVTQFHYTMWPDHGTPDPLCLMVFHRHVLRARADNDESPCVVHCSAGIGRTGTYIALDALYKEGKRTGKINVAEYVKVMRSCRMNMVQTYEQYEMIFLALAEEFKASVETRSLTDFMENTTRLDEDGSITQTTIRKDFENLLQIIPEYTSDDYKDARRHAQYKEVALPLDKFILYLTSSVKNRGSFINAIHVSSYAEHNAFIVTHYPPPEDAVDFLRLLIDHESDTVICMDPLGEIESSKTWLPERSSSRAVSPFRVEYTGHCETDVKMNNISIMNAKGHRHHVVIVEPQTPTQSSGRFQDTLSIRSLVTYAIEISTGKRITIVSKDGASLCGVFCAVFNSVQQIIMEGNVDVFTTVRQLQTRRPEFCSTLEEYMFVHRALRDYIETVSEKVYYNQ